MSNVQTTYSARSPFTLRLSPDEKALLKAWAIAAGMSNGEYVRHQLFGVDRTIHRTRGRAPVKDKEALGEVLSLLGRTRVSSNLNQLAKAANTGMLVLDEDSRAALLEACADIREIREYLLRALGVNSPT